MRNGGDKRGSSHQRRLRKLWLLKEYGDGQVVDCIHCGKELIFGTLEADRILPGGSYSRENVQPSCRNCNVRRSNNWIFWWLYEPSLPAQA